MRRNSARIGAPQFLLVLLSLESHSSLSFCSQFLLFQHSSAGIRTPWSPLAWLELRYFIPCTIHPFPCSLAWDGSSVIPTGSLIVESALGTPNPPFRCSSVGRALINPHQGFPAWIGTALFHSTILTPPPPPIRPFSCILDASQSPSALRSIDLALLCFIPHLFNTALPNWHSSCPWLLVSFSSECIILPIKPQFRFAAS